MTDTINNQIPLVPENTIDPAAGLNLSLNTIDALLQVLVQTVGANTPPTGVGGQRFIVGTAPTGAWAGQANKLARFLNGAWQFFDARYVLNAADGLWYVRSASTWSPLAGGGGGDVVGPASAVNNGVALFDGITGKLLKDGGVLGSAAFTASTAYATAAQGALADTALQPTAIGATVREKLVADRTYYVRTDGSDSNDGTANSSGGAFLSIQKAVDVAASLDLGVYNVIVRCSGAFDATVTLKSITGAGYIEIRGDASDLTSFSVSVSGGDCFSFGNGFSGLYKITYVKLSTSSSGRCIGGNGGGGGVIYGNVDFGNAAQAHIAVSQGQFCAVDGPITISGSAAVHLQAFDGGSVRENNTTISILGNPSFSQFASAQRCGTLILSGNTYTGPATGARYNVPLNGVIFTNGAGANYLPGSVAGVSATGGQYA